MENEFGFCPECGSFDCDCLHETDDGDELRLWCRCNCCGKQFVEVFKQVIQYQRTEEWKENR